MTQCTFTPKWVIKVGDKTYAANTNKPPCPLGKAMLFKTRAAAEAWLQKNLQDEGCKVLPAKRNTTTGNICLLREKV